MADLMEPYERFDAWTRRTGILDGGGLTWMVRIPLNIAFVVVLLVMACLSWGIDGLRGRGSSNA